MPEERGVEEGPVIGFPDCARCAGRGLFFGGPCHECARRHRELAAALFPFVHEVPRPGRGPEVIPKMGQARPVTLDDIQRLARTPMTVAFDLIGWTTIRAALLNAMQVREFAERSSYEVALRLITELTRRLAAADPIFRPLFVQEVANLRGWDRLLLARAVEAGLKEGA
jgi:hypothetical protein